MAPQHNTYVEYKKDTRYLLHWMIHTHNEILKSCAPEEDGIPKGLNTTGQTTVSGLVSMSELISQHLKTVPSVIYHLFWSVIGARSATYSAFQQVVTSNPDPELERSNATHKHFIDSLTKAFNILGGEAWLSGKMPDATNNDDEDDIETVIFANKFRGLSVEGEQEGDAGSEDENNLVPQPVQGPRKVRPKGKSKKGKKGKKPKKKQKSAISKEGSLDDVPLESYRIIEDEGGIITDYLIAVYTAVKEWISLRGYTQSMWKQVAYKELNSAVAGAVSNMAITMIKRTGSTIFVDFPGHDSYETIMQTITRGNPDKAQGNFHATLYRTDTTGNLREQIQDTAIDVKEQFLIYAYQDLLAFIKDFQTNRSGKPTKTMQAKLRGWDPNFDLQRATKQERLDWRRSYTINWLYDLVNVFSSIVVQRNTMKGESHAYASVDWSVNGPWDQHRRLFGLVEFAGDVTSLAMKNPGTDVRQKILPHHVFQLQCIVDSFAVSRGWSVSGLRGHIVEAPARNFRPRRDVDLFLDRETKNHGSGYLQGVFVLRQMLERDGIRTGDPTRHQSFFEVQEMMGEDFRDWLGISKYKYGLTTIPPSRFSDTDSNGLWEYSPFLCGTGLMEGLELAYRLGMILWDRMTEPMLLIHLHNMLVQKRYLERPIGFYTSLEELFKESFFSDGKVPTTDFVQALFTRLGETGSRFSRNRRRRLNQTIAHSREGDIHDILALDANRFFQKKSTLILFRTADWNADGIPDEDVPVPSFLFMQRLAQTKTVVDPESKRIRPEDTFLVRRAKAIGMSEDIILDAIDKAHEVKTKNGPSLPAGLNSAPGLLSESYRNFPASNGRPTSGTQKRNEPLITGRDLLDWMKMDISTDVSGAAPRSSLNYPWATVQFLMLFTETEERLKELRNVTYVQAYEEDIPEELVKEDRVRFALRALTCEDDECLTVMAEVFEQFRIGFMAHIYWKDLSTTVESDGFKRQAEPNLEDPDICNMM
ncbi:Fc.00g048230.m01.CDS01 [Cosmosporella sp. VM-42]